MVRYFKDVTDRNEKWNIELGKKMTHRMKHLTYIQSTDLIHENLLTLKEGTTLYPDDEILVRMWDNNEASWYLVILGVIE